MGDTSLDTRIFEERLRIKPAPWLTLETWEDLQLCLRYSQAMANEKYSMETQPQQWFAVALATLQSLKFTLFEHTHKTIVYEPHLLALSDVYSGYLPPPREKGPWFKSLEENVQAALQSAGTHTFTVMNASSHLSIEMDHEGDKIPVAILFQDIRDQYWWQRTGMVEATALAFQRALDLHALIQRYLHRNNTKHLSRAMRAS